VAPERPAAEAVTPQSVTRPVIASKYALDLDGAKAGFQRSVEGGVSRAAVTAFQVDTGPYLSKHITAVVHEPFVIDCGVPPSLPLRTWIRDMARGVLGTRQGVIHYLNAEGRQTARAELGAADVSRVVFPECLAGSGQPGSLKVDISPTQTRIVRPGDNSTVTASPPGNWIRGNFRLSLSRPSGTPAVDTSGVARITPLTLEAQATTDSTGKKGVRLKVSDFFVYFSEPSGAAWRAWFQDFVINGNNGQAAERSAKLEYLSSDLRVVLWSVTLHNVGITAIGADASSSVALGVAQLYAERVSPA
jgi:hypothetical protein